MPALTFPKSALEPRPNLPPGHIQVMFQGFKPKLSKKQEGKEQSINLNPELVIVNDQRTTKDGKPLNGQKVFETLNVSFGPRLQDFFHAFGEELQWSGDGDDATFTLPGFFSNGTEDPDPSKWGNYNNPNMQGKVATLELAEVASRKAGAKPTDTQTDIKRYICAMPQGTCKATHMESMLR